MVMQTLDEAWNASEAQSIEDAAAAMKEKAWASVVTPQPKVKSKPAVAVAAEPAVAPGPKQRRKQRAVKAQQASGPVASIRAAIAEHQAEIVRLKGALKLLKGAA